MSSFQRLKEEIQSQIGTSHRVEDDYSFLQPGGNDHLTQFLLNLTPDTYDELEPWDRNNFLLMDLLAECELEFLLDDEGEFARLRCVPNQKRKPAWVVLDLRDPILSIAYYYGDSKACLQLNQRICHCSRFSAGYFDTDILREVISGFEKSTMTCFDFEQSRSMFISPAVVKGKIKGVQAHNLVTRAIVEGGDFYNIDHIGGFLSDGARGEVSVDGGGYVIANSCRLSDFLDFAETAYTILRAKYEQIVSQYVTQMSEVSKGTITKASGGAIEFSFPITVDKVEGLINFFLKGTRDAQFVGTAERLSRKLWRIKTTECNTGVSLDIEVSATFVRIYIMSKSGIPLLDIIEKHIRCHVSARIERLVY